MLWIIHCLPLNMNNLNSRNSRFTTSTLPIIKPTMYQPRKLASNLAERPDVTSTPQGCLFYSQRNPHIPTGYPLAF